MGWPLCERDAPVGYRRPRSCCNYNIAARVAIIKSLAAPVVLLRMLPFLITNISSCYVTLPYRAPSIVGLSAKQSTCLSRNWAPDVVTPARKVFCHLSDGALFQNSCMIFQMIG